MKSYKKALLAGVILGCMPMMTACSFKETLGILWNGEDKEKDAGKSASPSLEAARIDENVQVPVVNNEPVEPVTYGLGAEAQPLSIEASVEDGGTLSYQWYRNNVDSNGGGTVIEGAVESSFIPPTSEVGTTYYYVVVTNTIDKGIQMTVSTTRCVIVTEAAPEAPAEVPVETPAANPMPTEDAQGTFQQNEYGIYFVYQDGTIATSKWERINGELYSFDESGIMRVGWYQEGGKTYFLNFNGTMAHDTEIDGHYFGPDGVMQQ